MWYTFSIEPHEDWESASQTDGIVAVDPAFLHMMFQWKLGNLGREGVGKLHGTPAHFCSGMNLK